MNTIQTSEEPTSRDDAKLTFQKMPIKELGKRTVEEFKGDEVPELAAGVAYHAIFAIPPIIIFMVTLASLVDQVTASDIAGRLRNLINERAPAETQELLTSLVDTAIADVSGGAASFAVLMSAAIALWSGSNGVSTIIRAFNRAYDVDDDRAFVKKKLLSLGLTVLMGVLTVLAFTLFVFGEQIGSWVAERVGLGSAFEVMWNILRWPMAIVFFMFMLAVLYYLGPNVEQSFHWISPGSVIATLLWIVVTFGFKFYVTYANPGSAYGALGGVVVLMFYLYLSSIVFLVGAEINAVLQRRYDEKTVEDLANHPEKAANSDERAANEQNARDFDRREGTATTSGVATVSSTQPVAQLPAESNSPGLGKRAATFAGSMLAAFAVSKLRRDKERH
jgi:membrane protein